MEEGSNTEYCSNCKRDIPSVNYVMHVNHCRRNITLCKHCQEPVPTSQLEEHFDESHVKVKCECGESMEKMDLEEHKEKSCACRSVTCDFCELSLPSSEMQSHKEYCGSRTELCEKCNKYIKFRDLEEHSSINCELVKPEAPKNRGEDKSSSVPPRMLRAMGLTDHEDQEIYEKNFLYTQDLMKVFQRGYGTRPIPDPYAPDVPDLPAFHNFVPRGVHQSRSDQDDSRRRFKANNKGPLENDDDNPFYKKTLQNNGKAASTKSSAAKKEPGPKEHDHKPNVYESFQSDDDYDFMPSYLQDQEESSWHSSLQSRRPRAIQSRVLEEQAITASLDETHLPCEFCDGMFPAGDLILHQSGCQLLLLNSSSHPPNYDNSKSRSEHPMEMQVSRPSASTDEDENENYYKEEEQNGTEPKSDLDEEPFLPCEFCQVLLPIHALFHHQATCDIRPPSALPKSDPPHQHHARMRPRPSRPARPVHTRALDPDSSDEDNRNAEDTFNKPPTGSSYTRKQLFRPGADNTRNSTETSSANTTMSERTTRKSIQRSTSNDLSSNDPSRKNRTRNNEFSKQGSRGRPENDIKVEGELAPTSEEKARDVRPKKLLSTAAGQSSQQKTGKTRDTSMMDEPRPTRPVRTGNKAQGYGNEDTAAARRKTGPRAPAKSDSSSGWTQPKTASAKPLEAASLATQIRGKSNLSEENPRRAGVKTFDLNEAFSSTSGSNRLETREAGSRRAQRQTQRKQPRKKIA